MREIVRALRASIPSGGAILDLGCGTGPAGAAWAVEQKRAIDVTGVDLNPWVLEECRWNYRQLGIRGTAKQTDIRRFPIPAPSAVIAAFTINELEAGERSRLHDEFLHIHKAGLPVLIIEPIARKLTTWWDEWAQFFVVAGGRQDEWRFRIPLPARLALMDRAAGLDHRELTGRSLWLPGRT